MNDADLADIRARDAAAIGTEGPSLADDTYTQRTLDRRALLAEVDRLRGDNAVLSDAMVDRNIDRWDRGVAAERARIRAAVEGLRVRDKAKGEKETDYFLGYRASRNETVTAVLAAIEGAEHD